MDERQEILSFATEYAQRLPLGAQSRTRLQLGAKRPGHLECDKAFYSRSKCSAASADSPKARDQHQAHISQTTGQITEQSVE